MHTRRLRYFLAILEHGSIRGAAEKLDMTQPALSQALASLETDFGSRLLNRSRSGISLTAVGSIVERRAREILSDVSRLREEVSDLQTLECGEVRLGIASIVAPSAVTKMISGILLERPGITIAVRRGGSEKLWKSVARGELDLAIARMPAAESEPEIAGRKLKDDPYVIWASKDHPLTTIKNPTVEDLRRYPWVFASEWKTTFAEMATMLETLGDPSLSPSVDCAEMEVAAALMSNGPFLSIWPKSCFLDTLIAGRYSSFPIPGKTPTCSIGVIWRARREPSPAAKMAIRNLSSVFLHP
jgi:DNA-binding transcriptional LysR family regulator